MLENLKPFDNFFLQMTCVVRKSVCSLHICFFISTSEVDISHEDHSYAVPSKCILKRQRDCLQNEVTTLQKKLKLSQQKARRLQVKCESLEDVLSSLKEKNLVTQSAFEILKESSDKIPSQVIQRLFNNKLNPGVKRKLYSNELRTFAVTLNFYSAKAYSYVRQHFDLCLPHESTIRRWYSAVKANTGFTEEAFKTLEIKVKEEESKKKEVLVSLVFDEVSIRKQIEWNGKSFDGCVDLGIFL
jgi:hypothetical protein